MPPDACLCPCLPLPPPLLSRRLFAGAILIAIPKAPAPGSDAPAGIRPIAIGESLVRVITGAQTGASSDDLAAAARGPRKSRAVQFGLDRNGCPKLVHLLHAAASHGDLVVKIDCRNAFNSVDRATALGQLYSHPELAPLFGIAHNLYSAPSPLLVLLPPPSSSSASPSSPPPSDAPLPQRVPWPYSHEILQSSSGVRQGCVLGSVLFDLAIGPALQVIAAQLGDSLAPGGVAAYHDDVYIILHPPSRQPSSDAGPVPTAEDLYARALLVARAALGACSLTVNDSKCALVDPAKYADVDAADLPSAPAVPSLGSFLQTPLPILLNSSEFLSRVQQQVLGHVHAALDPLVAHILDTRYPDAVRFSLYRNCVLTKFVHLFRTTPSCVTALAARFLDDLSHMLVSSASALPADAHKHADVFPRWHEKDSGGGFSPYSLFPPLDDLGNPSSLMMSLPRPHGAHLTRQACLSRVAFIACAIECQDALPPEYKGDSQYQTRLRQEFSLVLSQVGIDPSLSVAPPPPHPIPPSSPLAPPPACTLTPHASGSSMRGTVSTVARMRLSRCSATSCPSLTLTCADSS